MTPSNEEGRSLVQLVERTARGDETALEELYHATVRRVYGLAVRILGDGQAAEEITLDVYKQVWRSPDSYRPSRGAVLTWLVTLARSRAIDRLRSERRAPLEGEGVRLAAELPDPLSGPAATAGNKERAQHVRRALERISVEQREAVTAAFFGGLSHTQIAQAFGIPLGTVKRRIRGGLERLRSLLDFREEELA